MKKIEGKVEEEREYVGAGVLMARWNEREDGKSLIEFSETFYREQNFKIERQSNELCRQI